MAYVKHAEHGNRDIDDTEVAAHVAAGWVVWPRSREQKAGIAVPPKRIEAPVTGSRDSLMLDAACYGVKVDRRWSNQRLAAELAHAKSEKA